MATMRMAAGNLLGTVADTANAVSTLANTVSGGVSILNDMVQNIKNKRREATLVEMDSYRENLINDANLDAVKREENIRNYIGNDPEKQQRFNENDARLRKLFEAYDKIPTEE